MTVRNGEPYLHDAVSSILNQTHENFRFLILDNASTDNSRQVIRAFRDPRIDLVELPEDIGQTAALKRGLQMINTPWVARMDADDVSSPQRLELQMAYLECHPEVVLLGTGLRWIDSEGQFLRDSRLPVADVDIRWLHYVGDSGLGHSSVVFSSTAVKQAGGYPIQYRYAQDYALWCRLVNFGRVANLPQPLVYIRQHGSNATDSGLAEQETRAILKQHLYTLFPGESDATLAAVARAVRSDFPPRPSSRIVDCLSALPERFMAKHGCRPSRALLRQYGYPWLYMARVASLRSQRGALRWIKLALQVRPSLLAHIRLWYTLVLVAFAPVRRWGPGRGVD
jgi:hypothetical protein